MSESDHPATAHRPVEAHGAPAAQVDGARPELGPGPLSRVRRHADRGRYDRATVHAVLDEGLVCHLGFVDNGQPCVLPTLYARVGDVLYLHGAPANRALLAAGDGQTACVTVTLLDGLVLARSTFNHSLNYRSVVAFGQASTVETTEEKRQALEAIVEHVLPGRSKDARPPTDAELRATRVLRFAVSEASAKVRTGGPLDEPEDLQLRQVWAGELPLSLATGTPVVDTQAPVEAPVPSYVAAYRRLAAG